MDALLDTLCEGPLSFLEISTFPEMLFYSAPTRRFPPDHTPLA